MHKGLARGSCRWSLLAVLVWSSGGGCAAADSAEVAAGAAVAVDEANAHVVPVRDGGNLLGAEAQSALCLTIVDQAWPQDQSQDRDWFVANCTALRFSTTRRTESTLYWDLETNGALVLALRVSVSDGQRAWDGRLTRSFGEHNRFTWSASIDRLRSEVQTEEMDQFLRDLARRDRSSVDWGRSIAPLSASLLPPEVLEDAEIALATRAQDDPSGDWAMAEQAMTVARQGQPAGTIVGFERRSSTIGARGKLVWYDAFGRWVLETDWAR